MPNEPFGWNADRQSAAIKKLDGLVADMPAATRLPDYILEQYRNHCFRLGWQIPVEFSDGIHRTLYVLIDADFPYISVRIALANRFDALTWPHLERDGLLCILPQGAAISNEKPIAVAEYILGQACKLIEDSIHARNIEDFRQEFLSYWNLAVDNTVWKYISLLEPSGPSRQVKVWRGQEIRIVGESKAALDQWLEWNGVKRNQTWKYRLFDGVMIWLPMPLLPAEYPKTAHGVMQLVRKNAPDAVHLLKKLALSSPAEIDVLLGAQTSNGACFAAVTLKAPRHGDSPLRTRNILTMGFRKGRVPSNLLVSRYLSGDAKVPKSIVKRADHMWVHGRDQDLRQACLRNARVAILGCGSLGSSVARLLAQAGTGKLLLVDYEKMDWPNVSRHELGAQSVGCFKSEALADKIKKEYPHLREVLWRHTQVGVDARELIDELESSDLIVSAMGDWAAESLLNDIQQSRCDFPPILYSWMEPHAAAAHAVLITRNTGCLRCGTDDKGHPVLTVTEWPTNSETFQEPACGAQFSPYGPTELCWAHALVSEAAIEALIGHLSQGCHRVWIGAHGQINAAGGKWATNWIEEMGHPGTGRATVERLWSFSKACPTCKGQTNAA